MIIMKKNIKKICKIALILSAMCAAPIQANAFTVEYLCENWKGDIDIYVHEFTTETPYEVEVELYEQCRNIDRLFIGYPEK